MFQPLKGINHWKSTEKSPIKANVSLQGDWQQISKQFKSDSRNRSNTSACLYISQLKNAMSRKVRLNAKNLVGNDSYSRLLTQCYSQGKQPEKKIGLLESRAAQINSKGYLQQDRRNPQKAGIKRNLTRSKPRRINLSQDYSQCEYYTLNGRALKRKNSGFTFSNQDKLVGWTDDFSERRMSKPTRSISHNQLF